MLLELASWMQWALAVDQQLEKLDRPAYPLKRVNSPDGHGLLGLDYVWGLLKHEGHRLPDLVLVEGVLDAPIVHQAYHPPRSRIIRQPAWEARWKPLDELRAGGVRPPRRNKEHAYRARLEGRSVTTSCAPMQAFLVAAC